MSEKHEGRSQVQPFLLIRMKTSQAEAHAASCANEALINPDQLSCYVEPARTPSETCRSNC